MAVESPSASGLPPAASPPIDIPFNKPFLTGNELTYITEAIRLQHSSGDGSFTRRAQKLLEEITGAKKSLLTTSCTDALELSALLMNIQADDEVIVPSFTFVSTANAFCLRGAKPVFVDIRPDTLNFDESQLESLITGRTRAIVVVHYAGVACEMDEILRIAGRHGIPVIEDNAHGLFGRYKHRPLGTFGVLAAQSFHETKNVTCGEGGALLINDDALIERAEIIREKGTNRARFHRGQVDKYTWVDIGSSFLPSDILAAYLLAQLESRDAIQVKRRRIWSTYDEALRSWSEDNDVRRPFVPEHVEQPYHMYYLLLPSLDHRQAFLAHLRRHGILAVFHYVPLHLSEMGRRVGRGSCPVTEKVSDCLVRLPFYNSLTESDQQRVIAAVTSFRV